MRKKYLVVLPLIAFVTTSCSGGDKTPSNVTFTLKQFAEPVEFHTTEQLSTFINNFSTVLDDTVYKYLEEYDTRLLNEDMTLPLPVELSWQATAEGGSVSKYTVLVSEKQDFRQGRKINLLR